MYRIYMNTLSEQIWAMHIGPDIDLLVYIHPRQ